MIRDFQGKAAFVTGSASGIGLAIARVLAAANMRVMLADIEENALYAALEDLKASGADVRAVVDGEVVVPGCRRSTRPSRHRGW
ncbi:SDR family NAD(P)-dependent oxidoreductase [Bradyrhizobium sp. 2S1]|uniref:SDR family NAD(P)-dependent oxidoreductase n=1 Tax=Bradyrhizobium sp. 2S1 TaxID=1404429 RepID=UPI00140C0C46|nr:SDR family NAD(P)-dependent oxidoreductase [Bradyrhizobium sp. 2S1]MCK7665296.1 SDR family NAD(P)-dependent oxidoreductase [Bradyrhizobium sp. 2S1]